jgi:hypothetical protein
MANTSSWAPGNLNSGSFAYMAAFGAEINSLAAGNSVMSSVIFDNSGAVNPPDQWMDLSALCTIVSTALTGGAALSFWLAYLQGDGTTYGDGRVATASPGSAYIPAANPVRGIQIPVGTVTAIIGDTGMIPIRPRKFKLIIANNLTAASAPALAASGNAIYASFYRENLNA